MILCLAGAAASGRSGQREERVALALTQADFNRLVDEHGPTMYRIAHRMLGDQHEAEDMVQEAFRSVWKSRARYDPERGDRAWLVSILRRRIIDRWRRKPPPSVAGEGHELEVGVAGEDPFRDEFSDEIQAALDRLPDELRETLLLVVVGELTHQEAADVLDVPLGTVLSRVSRARARLREYLATYART
jgi:RNA polymerase sigma-70 factor (ECF subfamily)